VAKSARTVWLLDDDPSVLKATGGLLAGWIKTVGEWIGKRPADVPTAAAQKEKFEAKEVLREAERKDAIKVLKTELQRLTQENQELRTTVERLTWENKQAEVSISLLEQELHVIGGS
jgi:predicted RNase H-like nuclease (RuvC/YqgF family)